MKELLKASLKEAMKAKDKIKLDTIRAVLSAIQYEEMRLSKDEIGEAAEVAVVQSEIKKRREAIELFEKGNRPEAVEAAKLEIAVLESFLPQQLSQEQLQKIVSDLLAAEPTLQMGQIMKTLKEQYSGQYDGKVASSVISSLLKG